MVVSPRELCCFLNSHTDALFPQVLFPLMQLFHLKVPGVIGSDGNYEVAK